MINNLEILANDNNLCGESPLWDPVQKILYWVDIDGFKIFKLHLPTMSKYTGKNNFRCSALALHESGNLVVAGDGLHLWKQRKNLITLCTEYNGKKLKFNDIIADPVGRIYAGTLNPPDPGNLYKIDTDGSIEIIEEGIKCSNGIGFSPDNRTLYYTDSRNRVIYSYDYNASTGNITNRRILIKVPETEGLPDGMTVDAEGYIWSAQWEGSQLVRYDPEGKVERQIPMPVRLVTSVMFGGEDLTDLFITSANQGNNNCVNPDNGGCLFRFKTHFQGRPENMAKIKFCTRKLLIFNMIKKKFS